jgi:hypothetical protein
MSFLSASELLSCQRVNQVWRELAQDRSLWRELLGSFVQSSPFVCANHNTTLQPHDDHWQLSYFRLTRLVDLKGRTNPPPPASSFGGSSTKTSQAPQQRGPHGLLLPSCPFCAAVMQQPDDEALALTETQSSRKTLICCEGCDLFVWINGCEQCGQATAHLTKCFICSAEVCARCFGAAGKRCEQCGVNGCRNCVRPKATFAETNTRPGAGPKKKKKKKKRRNGNDEDTHAPATRAHAQPATSAPTATASHEHHPQHHPHHQQRSLLPHMCTFCGVTCANCERVFESEDTDFCVACESSVCYSCDCPCGALDMFQQMRI